MAVAAERWNYLTYDGTNAAAIVEMFSAGRLQWEVVSEAGGVLTVRSVEAEPTEHAFIEGDHAMIRGRNGSGLRMSPDQFAELFYPLT